MSNDKIWVVLYKNGTADWWKEDQGPPSWPYLEAFKVEEKLDQLRAELAARDAEFREEEKRRLALVAGMNELRADLATLRANHDLARKQNDHLMRVVEAIRDALKQALTGGEE